MAIAGSTRNKQSLSQFGGLSYRLPGDPGHVADPGDTVTTTYGPEGNPYFPGTIAYQKRTGTYKEPTAKISELEKGREERVAARETEVRGLLDEIIQMYGPEGKYGQGTLAMLEQQKKRDVAAASQALVSSGLSNTTMPAGLAKKWESEVGMPSRMKLEDVRYGHLAQAIGAKAQFITDIEDENLDYRLLSELYKTQYGG